MKAVLPNDPKWLKGFRFPEAIPVDLSDVSLETIWPHVFRLGVLEGSESTRGRPDQSDISRSINALSNNERLPGFNTDVSKQVLDRIVRSALIRVTTNKKANDLQIDALVPYSLAAFKVGLPTNQTGFRQIDRFLYAVWLEEWGGDRRRFRQFLVDTFGAGVKVQGAPRPGATRDLQDCATLDIITELSICYVEHFESIQPVRGTRGQEYEPSSPISNSNKSIGRDLNRFVMTYRDALNVPLLIEQLTTLVGLELLTLTLDLFDILPALSSQTSTPWRRPKIFVDFTEDQKSLSRRMAIASLHRSLDGIDSFVSAVLRLRYLHHVARTLQRNGRIADTLSTILNSESTFNYLCSLSNAAQDERLAPWFDTIADTHVQAIESENIDEKEADPLAPSASDPLLIAGLESPLDRISVLLMDAQVTSIRTKIMKWLRSVGGVGNPWGLINGAGDRRSWCYAPGNDLLMVLVQLCAIDRPDWDENPRPQKFGLKHFLEWLERRFGILVDRPPADLGFDSPEHMAAARENLQAMLRRLRQMGIFEDRSDDFSVQKLTPPFMDAVA